MIDLLCLVPDKNTEAAVGGILSRPQALGIRAIGFETIRHPNHDSGCFHQATELLMGNRERTTHAIVVLDRLWDGTPADTAEELERLLLESLCSSGLANWAEVVVIDPELESWVFSDSPHVARSLGWSAGTAHLRAALNAQTLWAENLDKPVDPKAAVEWVLRQVRKPRSSSIYRELAGSVSLERCKDRAFLRLKGLPLGWFGTETVERSRRSGDA